MPAQPHVSAAPSCPRCASASLLKRLSLLACILLFCQVPSAPGAASLAPAGGPVQHCVIAARLASRLTGVPSDVLHAISLAETGRDAGGVLEPWPWTVNMEGAGHWFSTEQAASAFVFENFRRGARSFDVGCFQINYKWHRANFASIEQMFDPSENALYAARFLKQLHAELGSWTLAAGAYHSRTPAFASRYAARFDALRAKLQGKPDQAVGQFARHGAGFPSASPLLAGQAARLGSLVPHPQQVTTARRALIVVP